MRCMLCFCLLIVCSYSCLVAGFHDHNHSDFKTTLHTISEAKDFDRVSRLARRTSSSEQNSPQPSNARQPSLLAHSSLSSDSSKGTSTRRGSLPYGSQSKRRETASSSAFHKASLAAVDLWRKGYALPVVTSPIYNVRSPISVDPLRNHFPLPFHTTVLHGTGQPAAHASGQKIPPLTEPAKQHTGLGGSNREAKASEISSTLTDRPGQQSNVKPERGKRVLSDEDKAKDRVNQRRRLDQVGSPSNDDEQSKIRRQQKAAYARRRRASFTDEQREQFRARDREYRKKARENETFELKAERTAKKRALKRGESEEGPDKPVAESRVTRARSGRLPAHRAKPNYVESASEASRPSSPAPASPQERSQGPGTAFTRQRQSVPSSIAGAYQSPFTTPNKANPDQDLLSRSQWPTRQKELSGASNPARTRPAHEQFPEYSFSLGPFSREQLHRTPSWELPPRSPSPPRNTPSPPPQQPARQVRSQAQGQTQDFLETQRVHNWISTEFPQLNFQRAPSWETPQGTAGGSRSGSGNGSGNGNGNNGDGSEGAASPRLGGRE